MLENNFKKKGVGFIPQMIIRIFWKLGKYIWFDILKNPVKRFSAKSDLTMVTMKWEINLSNKTIIIPKQIIRIIICER